MFFLVIQSGKHAGKRIPIRPESDFVIGRDADCQLRLASSNVSRRHCRLTVVEGKVRVEDLKSRNGTFLDGFLLQAPAMLRPDSLLGVGGMEFKVKSTSRPTMDSQAKKTRVEEDEICSWLTEDGETDEVNLDDSTIIPGSPKAEQITRQVVEDQQARHPDADAAAEIIRNHWQTQLNR